VSIRFYCPEPPQDGRYRLRGDEARHLGRVSRHVPGDLVELFDGKGFATIARIVDIAGDEVDLVAEGPPIAESPRPTLLTLATAIPKGERFDWLVEKATELGVERIIPLVTERSVVDPRISKIERMRRAIIEASKQSRRNRLMSLDPTVTWLDLVRSAQAATRLVALPDGLPPGRWPLLEGSQSIILAIGPEGGFSPSEEELARANGWHPIRLNSNVLRVETAGIAGAAAILTRCEEQDVNAAD
jgi:16S rRNA (uracil1498-N3)-methyltransferase